MGLAASDSAVYKLLSEKMYSVPSNQRKYVWKANNWNELLDDINTYIYDKHTSAKIRTVLRQCIYYALFFSALATLILLIFAENVRANH